MTFEFLSLRRADFPVLSSWLTAPHVARWWDDDASLDAIDRDYGGCVDGTEPCEVFIAHLDGLALGLIQRYRFGAYPEYIGELRHIVDVTSDSTGIDYLVGPGEALGKGIGTAMIAGFVERTWVDDPATPAIFVPVHVDNRASWHALERAAFARIAEGELEPDNPRDSRSHYIYARYRLAA
jgi:aminoglycoside 6'-N-acetyltransferase